jgi:hypothetical protein
MDGGFGVDEENWKIIEDRSLPPLTWVLFGTMIDPK